MEATFVDENSHDGSHIMDTLNSSYKLQSLNVALFSCLQATSNSVNCVMAAGFMSP